LIRILYDAKHAATPALRETYISQQLEKEPEMKKFLTALCNLHAHVEDEPKKKEVEIKEIIAEEQPKTGREEVKLW
jgi:hypothetical protein